MVEQKVSVVSRGLMAVTFSFALLTGCKSKEDAAVDQAKQQAAATGQAQQVVMTDADGTTTTTVVQPPLPGQTTQAITVTKTSTKAGTVTAAKPAPTVGPVVGPVVGPAPVQNGAQTPLQGSVAPYDGTAQTQGGPVANNGAAPIGVNVHVAAGTPLTIRINQHISVKTNQAGDRFTGEVAEAVTGGSNEVLIPRGTPVFGRVDASHRRGHFKGASLLELRLTSMTLNGQQYALDTHDLVRSKKGKGKRSAAFIGGGAGLGMLIGGVASGGVGLLAGGLAGGGAGTAIAGLTGNRDLDIPAESLMRFRLADDLVVQPNQ